MGDEMQEYRHHHHDGDTVIHHEHNGPTDHKHYGILYVDDGESYEYGPIAHIYKFGPADHVHQPHPTHDHVDAHDHTDTPG